MPRSDVGEGFSRARDETLTESLCRLPVYSVLNSDEARDILDGHKGLEVIARPIQVLDWTFKVIVQRDDCRKLQAICSIIFCAKSAVFGTRMQVYGVGFMSLEQLGILFRYLKIFFQFIDFVIADPGHMPSASPASPYRCTKRPVGQLNS